MGYYEARGPVKWTYYYLYVILDIFSRYVVGWMLAPRVRRSPNASSPRAVAQDIEPDQLTLHALVAARKPVGLLRGVTKTHSRPYVSNDNPYSEAMKYCPRFRAALVLFCCGFFDYYNFHHRHSGIGLMHRPTFTMVEPNSSPPLGARSFSKLNRLIPNASFVERRNRPFCLRRPGSTRRRPRCRTSPSRGGVHTWGTPFFCFTQPDLGRC